MSSFQRMVSHLRSLILFRFSLGFVDNIVAKYVATSKLILGCINFKWFLVVGWYTMSRPFFSRTNQALKNKTKNEIMQVSFYTFSKFNITFRNITTPAA